MIQTRREVDLEADEGAAPLVPCGMHSPEARALCLPPTPFLTSHHRRRTGPDLMPVPPADDHSHELSI